MVKQECWYHGINRVGGLQNTVPIWFKNDEKQSFLCWPTLFETALILTLKYVFYINRLFCLLIFCNSNKEINMYVHRKYLFLNHQYCINIKSKNNFIARRFRSSRLKGFHIFLWSPLRSLNSSLQCLGLHLHRYAICVHLHKGRYAN